MGSLFRALRSLSNNVGLAWWVRIETRDPNVVYWFGPFLTRKGLNVQLSVFLKDLSDEAPSSVTHRVERCCRREPLTI